MNNEEMERAIEFLLEGQATLEQRVEQTNAQLQKTNAQVQQTNAQVEQTNAQLQQTNEQLQKTNAHLQQTDDHLQQTIQQLAELDRRLELYAETQSEFIVIAKHSIEALTVAQGTLTAAQEALTTAQAQTDARLNILIGVVERHITQGHDRQG